MIGLVAFVALAVSAAYGQGCSANGLSQAVVGAPVSGFSRNVLRSGIVGSGFESGIVGSGFGSGIVGSGFGSGIVGSGFESGIVGSGLSGNLGFGVASAPCVRSSVVSAPVFLNDGPALLSQGTCATAGPLVATPAVSQSVSPACSASSFLSGSVSGGSSFNSAVGPDQVIAVPAYSTPRIPSNQVSSTSVAVPSFPGVSSLNCGSAVSAPVVAQSISVPVSSGVFGSGISGFESGISGVVGSGCY